MAVLEGALTYLGEVLCKGELHSTCNWHAWMHAFNKIGLIVRHYIR